MERLLLFNGISPYLYFLAVKAATEREQSNVYFILLGVFLVQLMVTTAIAVICKDKKRLAKVTMINKLVQIPYYILFFVLSVVAVLLGMNLMGVGLLLIPFLVAIDFGVFLSTMIPEQICTIGLKTKDCISTKKFILFFLGNMIYVVDIVLSVLIHREYGRESGDDIIG